MLVLALLAEQPALATPSRYGEMLWVSLGVVAAIAVAGYLVAKAFGRGVGTGAGGALAVVARLPLEPRRSLYVVQVAGRSLLLGTSEMGLTLLTELDSSELPAQAKAVTFADLVRDAAQRWSARGSQRSVHAEPSSDSCIGSGRAETGSTVPGHDRRHGDELLEQVLPTREER
jgi:flagellar biogenesis protein FliO